jgi:predicted SnoaL-like aldol condensation-catalyzing enzyme
MKKLIMLLAIATLSTTVFAALPVLPGGDQQEMLASSDSQLADNKKIAYDFFRVVLRGLRLDSAPDYMHQSYMQHNPNAATGLDGFLDYFSAVLGDSEPPAVPDTLPGLVSIQAEGDYVTLSFVRDCVNNGQAYSTTWFDMFRIVDGKIAEHWDSAVMGGDSGC